MNSDSLHISLPVLIALQQQARQLRLRPLHRSANLSGAHISRLRGRGMEFDEVRAYQPGDDISCMDWKVTARKGSPHIKLFREERERPVLLCLDYRPNMFFATRGRLKVVQASHMAAMLAWAGIARGDRLGGLIFSADGHQELRPSRGRKAVLQWIHRCCTAPAWQQQRQVAAPADSLRQALLRLRRLAHPGSTLIILSDFRGLDDACREQLMLLSRHCECLLCWLYDHLEMSIPDAGSYRIHNGEQPFNMDANDSRLQQQVASAFEARKEILEQLCMRYGMHLIPLPTDAVPLDVLKSNFQWT